MTPDCTKCEALYGVTCRNLEDGTMDALVKSTMSFPQHPKIKSPVRPSVYREISVDECPVNQELIGFDFYARTTLAEDILSQPGLPKPKPADFFYLLALAV